MRARIALSHFISSSSLGAQSRRVRFVVTILKVCVPAVSPSPGGYDRAWCWGDCGPGDATAGWFLFGGRSYSSASMIRATGI